MEYHEYHVKGNVDLYKFTNGDALSDEIKKTLPSEQEFKIETRIDGAYSEKKGNSKKKKYSINFTLKIYIPSEIDHNKEFKEIKRNLEKLLNSELIENEI
jgi:hypothetical protein